MVLIITIRHAYNAHIKITRPIWRQRQQIKNLLSISVHVWCCSTEYPTATQYSANNRQLPQRSSRLVDCNFIIRIIYHNNYVLTFTPLYFVLFYLVHLFWDAFCHFLINGCVCVCEPDNTVDHQTLNHRHCRAIFELGLSFILGQFPEIFMRISLTVRELSHRQREKQTASLRQTDKVTNGHYWKQYHPRHATLRWW